MRLARGVGVMLLILSGCLAAPAGAQDVPLPPGLKVVPPESAIPPPAAGFSGKWAGQWSSGTPHVLVVLQIHPADPSGQYLAEVVYAWGDNLSTAVKGAFRRIKGTIKDGQLVVELGPTTAAYRLSGDRSALEGEVRGRTARQGGTFSFSGTFRRAAE